MERHFAESCKHVSPLEAYLPLDMPLQHVVANCDVPAKVKNWIRQSEKPQNGICIDSPPLIEVLARDDGAGLTHAKLKEVGVDKLFTTHYVQDVVN